MDNKGKLPKDDDWHPLRSAAVASGAGLTMLSSIALGVWAGLKIDEWLGTDPWGLILLGICDCLGVGLPVSYLFFRGHTFSFQEMGETREKRRVHRPPSGGLYHAALCSGDSSLCGRHLFAD